MLLSEALTFDSLVNAIASVGFPIVCVGYFAYYTQTLTKEHKEETTELANKLHEVALKLQELIDKLE